MAALCPPREAERGGRAVPLAADMVLLSAPRWLRSRLSDRFWRVQEVLKYARVSAGLCPAAPRLSWVWGRRVMGIQPFPFAFVLR